MNFDLTTTRLMHLLKQATPESWRRDSDEPAPGLKVTDDPRSRANVELAVLAPDLARNVVFMRASLAQLRAAMTAIAGSDKSSEPVRKLAGNIALQVNQLLADHDMKGDDKWH